MTVADDHDHRWGESMRPEIGHLDLERAVALGGVLVLIGVVVQILRTITIVVGGTRSLMLVVLLSLVGATVASRVIGPRIAGMLGLAAGLVGGAYYLSAANLDVLLVLEGLDQLIADSLALASGYSFCG
ncbi:MAG: hypothetical protein U5K37_13235 [Natrialbaceae archaeon]|nr:hypothetical protein [Natrialbaceae archaeon]